MPLTQHLSPWLPGVLVLLLNSPLHAEPVPVARGVRQLFFDNHFIAELDGLERVVNQASKPDVNPVLRREHPWEQFRAITGPCFTTKTISFSKCGTPACHTTILNQG